MKPIFSFENTIRIQGSIIALISLISIYGWLNNILILSSFSKESIPMALDSAFIFIIYGIILIIRSHKSSNYKSKIATIVSIAVFTIYGFLKSAEFFVNIDLTFENYLFPITEKLGPFPLKRMSPVTGFLFLIVGISFLIKIKYGEYRKTNNLISILGLLVAFLGFTVILGHLFQTPLLYESKIIPMALTTAICFLSLGVSIVFIGGRKNIITKQFVGKTPYNILIRTIIPILFTVILVQGLILRDFGHTKIINYAFLSAILSLILIIITSIIIIQTSKTVFRNAIIAENKSKQAEAMIQIKNELLKFTGEIAKIGGWEYITETHESTFTDEVAKIFELDPNQELNTDLLAKFFKSDSKKDYDIALKNAIKNAFSYDLELNIITNTGKQKCIRAIGIPISEDSKVVKIRGVIHDITEENEYEKKQQFLKTILSLLNNSNEWNSLISNILLRIKEFFNIDAIAIRINDGKDFPYYKTIGFPDEFLGSEQFICSRNADGEILFEQDKKPVFECYCGAVINDKTDSTKPYYTPYGSFLLNGSIFLNRYIQKNDLPFKFRNRCVREYESTALIPLRSDNEIIGLLQLNDKHKNMFPYETISFIEEIGSLIGIAFKKIQTENLIRDNEKRFRTIFESAAVGVALLNLNTWKTIEINKKYCEILGYTQTEMLNINLQDITYEEDKSDYSDLKGLLLNGEIKEYSTVKRYYHKNGNIVWVNLFISSIPIYDDTSKYLIAVVEDISAHKVIERALRDSMEHFRSITQTAGDAIISIDEEGKIITWNNAACSIFGYSEGEAIGLVLHTLIVPNKNHNKVLEGFQKFIQSGEGLVVGKTLEVEALTKEGKLIPVELSITSFKKGNQWHATGIVRDITERKNAEWSIHKRVKEIQCLQNITRITDKENLTLGKFVNKVVNIIPSGFQYPEKTHCRIVLKDQIFQTDSFVENESRFRANIVNKNKQIGYIDICLSDYSDHNKRSILKEEKGLIASISQILNEFIERKRKEQIQKIIYNSAIAVDSSNSLADLIEYIKNQIGLLIDTTNFFAALYDEETDSISLPYHKDQKGSITKFPAGKTLTKHVIKMQRPLLATKKQIDELEKLGIIETIGNTAAVWLGVPLIVKGKITGIFAVQSYDDEHAYNLDDLEMLEFISRQVSISIERKKVEQDLKAALSKTMESDRLKSTFLATMSHELRTPLNAVIGFSEMMLNEVDITRVPEFAGVINNSGLNLLEIIEDIFDITLLESGEVKVSKSEFSLSPLMDDIKIIIDLEREKLGKQTLDVKFNPPKDLNTLTINTDRSKLKHILINLLKNALKFTFEGYVEYGLSIEKSDNKIIKFYVKDTGIGIRDEDTEIIFENFRQVDDSNTRIFGGTGIGLSVAKKYSDMIEGKIWVESTFGKGSTFYLTLPYIEPVVKTAKIKEDQSISLKFPGKTILIAEDEASNYELLIVYLEDLEVNTLWAHDGEEAVSICESNSNIDLVLMDIKMPKMNGLDATSKIRKSYPSLPIIAQTAFVLHGDDEKAFEAGCNDYIGKPIKRRDLHNLLSKYLHS